MSDVRHALLQSAKVQPWRNGGGITREVLVWPHAVHWRVRVSVASITQSGPFSAFPGIARWFAVLDGEGVRLDLPRGAVTLAAGDEPVAFDGEAAPWCQLLGGPTQDLNLMAPRDAGRLRMLRAWPGSCPPEPSVWRALYAAAPLLLDIDGVTEPVHGGTLVWSDAPETSDWQLQHGGSVVAYWLTLEQ